MKGRVYKSMLGMASMKKQVCVLPKTVSAVFIRSFIQSFSSHVFLSALHLACTIGHEDTVKQLLSVQGLDIDAKDIRGTHSLLKRPSLYSLLLRTHRIGHLSNQRLWSCSKAAYGRWRYPIHST
jgi:hypothetical protein